MTTGERLASFVAASSLDEMPGEVVEAAKLHVLDTLGCGLAAQGLGEASYAASAAQETATSGPATAIGVTHGLPAVEAAMVNGILCHALDFDDTHPGSVVHVSAGVVPAALAAGEIQAARGGDVLAAIVAGNETSIRLGMAAGGAFHARGFHPTSVCGVFGATAAAARLRGLDAQTTASALGIAGSMASGVLEFLADGSDTKRLHPGWAAHAGLMAVRLAAHGATGPVSILEGDRGFYRTHLPGVDVDIAARVEDLGERWLTPEIAFKPYPACHYVTAPIDALAQVLHEVPLSADDVAQIVAFTDVTGEKLVLDPPEDKVRPRSAYDAKFSLPYCLAYLLVRGQVDVASFTDAAIGDPDVLAVTPRVTYEVKEYASAPDAFSGGVRVLTRDGQALEAEFRYQRGSAENPLSAADVQAKYRANAMLALSASTAAELETAILHLEDEPDLSALAALRNARAREATAVASG